MPYQSRYTATIADLMGAGQRARMEAAARAQQAEAEARNVGAQAWGNFAQNMGGMANNVAGVVLETQRQNKLDAIAARRDAETAKTNELHRQILQTQLTDRETAQQTAQRARERDMVLDAALKKAMKKDPNTGLVTFDRGMLQETFTQLGMMEQWPTYSTLIDQSDAAITGMKKARQEAVVALAKTVDQSGNNPVVFQNQVAMGLANGVFTPQDIAPILQGVGANPTAAQIAPVTAKLLGRQPDYKEVDPTKNIVDMNDPTKVLVTGTPKPPTTPAELAVAAGNPDPAISGPAIAALQRLKAQQAAPATQPLTPVYGPDGKTIVYGTRESAIGTPVPPPRSGQARAVTSADAGRITELDTSLDDLAVLRKTIAPRNAQGELMQVGSTGTSAAIGAAMPNVLTEVFGWGAVPKQRQATIDRVKQVIGKALEDGVLRKEDEYKYTKILPTISDTVEIVEAKLNGLDQAITLRRQRLLENLEAAEYDVSKFSREPKAARDGGQTIGRFTVEQEP